MSNQHGCFTYLDPDGNLQESPFPGTCEGPSIADCVEDHKGRLYAQGDGKSTQVNYCPFCGYKARVQIEWNAQPVLLETCRLYTVEFEKEAQSLGDKINDAQAGDVIYWSPPGTGDNARRLLEDMAPELFARQDDAP